MRNSEKGIDKGSPSSSRVKHNLARGGSVVGARAFFLLFGAAAAAGRLAAGRGAHVHPFGRATHRRDNRCSAAAAQDPFSTPVPDGLFSETFCSLADLQGENRAVGIANRSPTVRAAAGRPYAVDGVRVTAADGVVGAVELVEERPTVVSERLGRRATEVRLNSGALGRRTAARRPAAALVPGRCHSSESERAAAAAGTFDSVIVLPLAAAARSHAHTHTRTRARAHAPQSSVSVRTIASVRMFCSCCRQW